MDESKVRGIRGEDIVIPGKPKVGDLVAVICKVTNTEGVYPIQFGVMPISDDKLEFVACMQSILGKVHFTLEDGYHLVEEEVTS